MKNYSLLIMGGSNGNDGGGGVDGDGSGGNSPSRQGAGTGPSDPRAAEHGDVFRSFVNCVRVYCAEAIYGPKGSFRRFPRPPHLASARPDLDLGQPTCRACTVRIRTRMEMNHLYKTCGGKFPATFATRLFPFDVVFRPERDDL